VSLAFVTLAERPDLIDAMWSMPDPWPEFMLHDPVASPLFEALPEAFGEYQLLAIDDTGAIAAKLHSAPFAWAGTDEDLPARGLDAIMQRAYEGRDRGVPPTAVSLLEARVVPDHRGTGLSYRLLEAGRANVTRLGLRELFAPVRPTGKSAEPHTPMREYAARVRDDGLPADPWLRVHARMGARIVGTCPLSMLIPGTVAQWREWTGLELATSGLHPVPGALAPVHVSIEHDHALYAEPNVWMHHRLSADAPA
jgi:GNAT superfamily N-acetyltransferase